jgi:DNA (cytosine-5)-methyltransferase 1
MRYGSVCSGIEAATMAWHGLGWEPAFFSEIDAFPRAVLEHHYPNVPCHGDFTDIKDDEYGSIDLLVGGTPCQSFSVAGLRGGMDDDRGNLALEFIRLAHRTLPQWLVWENVPGVLSSNGGRDFGSFLGALAEIGYGFAYRVLDAQFFGVPQRRRRVFVVGYLGDWRRAAAVLFERESLSGNPAPSREEKQEATGPTEAGAGERVDVIGYVDSGNGGIEPNGVMGTLVADSPTGGGRPLPAVALDCAKVAPAPTSSTAVYECHGQDSRVKALGETCSTVTAKYGTGGGNVPIVTFSGNQESPVAGTLETTCHDYSRADSFNMAVASDLTVRRLTPTECERLQGFPDGFTQVPYRNKPAEKCPDGPRYKALGNSMAVPVMSWIGHRIQEVENVFS